MGIEQTGVRARAREAMTCALAELARELFDADGYENVTVADIAQAADISTRSFFRYFPNKDDVVFGSHMPTAEAVVTAFTRQAGDHTGADEIWAALHRTFRNAGAEMRSDADAWKQILRIIASSPELRAKNTERHIGWAVALAPHVAARLSGDTPERLADTMINTALTCFDVALRSWSQNPAQQDLAALVDDVFSYVSFSPR